MITNDSFVLLSEIIIDSYSCKLLELEGSGGNGTIKENIVYLFSVLMICSI